jgi:hypothetical protein
MLVMIEVHVVNSLMQTALRDAPGSTDKLH